MSRPRTQWPVRILAAGLLLAFSAMSWAHHSFAMFDKARLVKVQGVVRKVEWANPHVYLFVEAKDNTGQTQQYAVECTSVNDLTRHGWKMSTVKVGDQVTVAIYPLRDGKPGGLLDSVTLASGATIKG